jgi:hypothetical protein
MCRLQIRLTEIRIGCLRYGIGYSYVMIMTGVLDRLKLLSLTQFRTMCGCVRFDMDPTQSLREKPISLELICYVVETSKLK